MPQYLMQWWFLETPIDVKSLILSAYLLILSYLLSASLIMLTVLMLIFIPVTSPSSDYSNLSGTT